MTDMNQPNSSRPSGMFAHDIATDLASGRAVELAEVYALDAVTPAERADPRAIEIRYLIDSDDLESLGADLEWAPRVIGRDSPRLSVAR